MPIEINFNCQKRMKEVLQNAIANIKIQNGCFLDWESCRPLMMLDNILSKNGNLRFQLEQFVDDSPAFTFIYDRISRIVRERMKYDNSDKIYNLVDLTFTPKADIFAAQLIEQFISLPWDYSFIIELPKPACYRLRELGLMDSPVDIANGISLLWSDHDTLISMALTTGNVDRDKSIFPSGIASALLASNPELRQWNTDTAYLKFCKKGYISQHGHSAPIDSTIMDLKAIIGMGLSFDLFDLDSYAASQGLFGAKFQPNFRIFRREKEKEIIDVQRDLEEDLAVGIARLVASRSNGHNSVDAYRARLAILRIVFLLGEVGNKIRLAASWLFDGRNTRNGVTAFLFNTIVLEILLGDRQEADTIGLGALLANRCAYLIGESSAERGQILADFKNIYTIRSKIVHQDHTHPNSNEHLLLQRLRFFAVSVMHKELGLLIGDKRR